jgi:glycosyltransferase involved in cell wall biosynthesis
MNNEPIMKDTLIVSRTFFPKTGGIEEYIYNRCRAETDRIIVLAAGCPGDRDFDAVQPFPVYRWSIPEFLPAGKISSIAKQIINMFWSWWLAIVLYRRYRYRYIEWSHGYDFPSLWLLSYLLPVKCIIYTHGDDVFCPTRNPLLRSLFGLTLKRMHKIIANSSFTLDYISKNWQFNTPCQVINPRVRPEKFVLGENENLTELGLKIRQQYQIPTTSILILTVGRLVKRKGLDRVIKSLPTLLAEGVDVHYLICGKGKVESELKHLANNLGVSDRVHFAGFVSDRDLAAYYCACDLFAMLTFLEENSLSIEGFGIVYIEASYFGKPVIASRIGGVADAVRHNETGILVEPDNETEMLSALIKLCQDPELRQRLGDRGRELSRK